MKKLPPNITGVYVIHAKNGYEYHEKRIVDLLGAMRIPFEFVTDGDVGNFTTDLLKNYFTDYALKSLSPGVVSCTLNHILTYQKIIDNGGEYALVFENDPFFLGDFIASINAIFPEVEQLNGPVIVSLENSTLRFPSYFQTKKNKHLYKASSGRMAGAYLINRSAAEAALNRLFTIKCNNEIDIWHNELIKNNIVQMYWAHPAMVEQGSHNGRLNAGISSKPKSFKRRLAWRLTKLARTTVGRLKNQKRLIE